MSHPSTMPDPTTDQTQTTVETSQPYQTPAIVHDLHLETRAGSPLRVDPSSDPLGIDPTKQ